MLHCHHKQSLQCKFLTDYVLSWKLSDRDKAAGLACSTEDVLTRRLLSSPFVWNALKRPPLLRELVFSFLIPSVVHMELFAASLGSSILKVFGIQTHLSELFTLTDSFCEFAGLRRFPSLECLPKVGELGAELWPQWLREEDGGERHCIFQEPQYAGGG